MLVAFLVHIFSISESLKLLAEKAEKNLAKEMYSNSEVVMNVGN